MNRDVYQQLKNWKSSSRRKPLLLRGVRQAGKTYLLKQFGKHEYENLAYFNFEEEPELKQLFESSIAPSVLLPKLSRLNGEALHPKKTLIVFDEIQEAPRALSALKYFYEDAEDYHLAAAGSLLGVKLADSASFPVGKLNFIDLYPLHFLEFLEALGQQPLRAFLENETSLEAIPEKYHQEFIAYLKLYYVTGGMPEVVKTYQQTEDLSTCREVQQEIIRSYEFDFAKHAKAVDVPKITLIWNGLHSQLAKENKKFIFSVLKQSARGREYESSIQWLLDAGVITRCLNTKTARFPLDHYRELSIFKLYFSDIGLLGAMSRLSPTALMEGNRLFTDFHGAFVENYVAQQLTASFSSRLHYWTSTGKAAEMDFLWEAEDSIYPLEVKAGINPHSKSLQSFKQQYAPELLIRTTLLNMRLEHGILNIPLYAINLLPKWIKASNAS